MQSPTTRVRPWIKKLAIFAMPFVMAYCGLALWDYIETHRLAGEIDAIVARGEPVTLAPLVSRAYRKSDNAEYKYSAAAMLTLVDSGVENPTTGGGAMAGLRGPMDVYSRLSPVRQWLDGTGERPFAVDTTAVVRTLVSDWGDALSLVDRAAPLPYYGIGAGGEFDYRVAGLLNLSRLLSVRTIGLSLAGDADAAVDSAVSSLRLRRAIRPSQRWLPTIGHEIPAVLSLSRPSDEALQRLQSTLSGEEDPDGATRDFIEMRARVLNDAWQRIYRVAAGAQLPPPFPAELWPSSGMRPRMTHDLVAALRVWSELAAIAKRPWPERVSLAAEPIARYAKHIRPSGFIGPGIVVGIFYQATRPDLLVQDRSSRVAVAIERYRRAHADALPASLNDLVPRYLDVVPQDPLNGQALRYRVVNDVYIVYSVGPDGKDDGGVMLRQTPPSPAVQFPAGADMGIRVLIRHP